MILQPPPQKIRWKAEGSCSSPVGLAKHVRHFMNKQSSVCFFLQMVGFPPPHLFFVPLDVLPIVYSPWPVQSFPGYSDWFRLFFFLTFCSSRNGAKSDTFRQLRSRNNFPCSLTSCWGWGLHSEESRWSYATTPILGFIVMTAFVKTGFCCDSDSENI